MRRVLVLTALVAAVGYVASMIGDPPATAPNCDKTELVLGSKTLENTLAIRYVFTGPTDAAYVVAVDAASVQVSGGRVEVTPRPDAVGATQPHTKVLRPSDCRGSGTLSVDPAEGVRHVTLFTVDSTGRGVPADEQTVEVIAP